MEWIFESGEFLNCSRETMHLAACAFDRVHDVVDAEPTINRPTPEDLGITCRFNDK